MKTVYCLRIRVDDNSEWSEADYYRTRKARDECASVNRIIGGFRTHSFEEKKTPEEAEALFD